MNLCISFTASPSGAAMPDAFSLSAFAIEALQTPGGLMVATDGGEKALRCPNGLKLTLPLLRASVSLRIGTWNTPARLEAFDSAGASLGQQMVFTQNSYTDLTVSAPASDVLIHHITLTEGGHEANLASACIEIAVAG